jgi:hypothetical protein
LKNEEILVSIFLTFAIFFSGIGFKNKIVNFWKQKRKIRVKVNHQFPQTQRLVLNI